jgi:type I restriction enzyme, R subunit
MAPDVSTSLGGSRRVAPVGSKTAPEAKARDHIDHLLTQAGWVVQAREEMNLSAGLGVAVTEFPLKKGHGFVDYLLFLDGKPVGVVEAKPVGKTLTGVETQAKKYVEGIPPELAPPLTPLPFAYMSTGVVTKFINHLDPHPRSRRVFTFARPATMQEWLKADTLDQWLKSSGGFYTSADDTKPSTLRSRLQAMPPIERGGLWPNQLRAVEGLEHSFKQDKPRALIQMATGSGKSLLAVSSLYRLIKFGGARRVLFLVDRGNLGEQAEKEFLTYRTPDDHKKFDELYNVQRLTTNKVGSSSKVVISTVQRLYSVLKGEEDFDPDAEEHSGYEADLSPTALGMPKEPLPVVYNQALPPEFFDVIIIDECHRSIYSLWRQVIEYFDAYLIGLTATPAKHTFGFFNKNLVLEYPHEKAVADGVNCDYEVYKIRTEITAGGAVIEADNAPTVGYRDRATRKVRWEAPDEDVTYAASDLDRNVVAKDQIRLIIKTLRDRVLKETFPDRTEVPKTLIFAKDDSHAEDIVEIVREEFGRGNDFATKITYKVTGGKKPRDLIQDFRNSFNPRIAVTVDLIATGTDIKPVEIVMFMRSVKSRLLFEQMKGRGVRVIKDDELRAVTPDAKTKTHFLIVDCVGVTESKLSDSKPLDTKKSLSLKALLDHVAAGGTHPDFLTSLASRIARIDKQCGPEDQKKVEEVTGGVSLADLATALVEANDPDVQVERARQMFNLPPEAEPTDEQVNKAAEPLAKAATQVLVTKPPVRQLLLELRHKFEQVIDEVSIDVLLEDQTGVTPEAKEKAQALVTSFEEYLAEHKDEIDALQFFYSLPHSERLKFKDIKALAQAISSPPRSWTPEKLWRAYETLDRSKVRGASVSRLLTDVVSLVRFALHQDNELVPHSERVRQRFDNWVAQQENKGKVFTDEQRRWLDMMKDHIASSLEIEVDDFELTPFTEEGGLAKASQVFGSDLATVLRELNEVLAA